MGGHLVDTGTALDVVEQAVDPAAGFDLSDLHPVESGRRQRGGQCIHQLHLGSTLMLLDEGERTLDLIGPDVDPAAAQLDQRLFEMGEHFELFGRKWLVAKRQLPVVADQAVEAEQSRPIRFEGIRLAPGPQPKSHLEPALQTWQQHAEPTGFEQHRFVTHQVGCLAS